MKETHQLWGSSSRTATPTPRVLIMLDRVAARYACCCGYWTLVVVVDTTWCPLHQSHGTIQAGKCEHEEQRHGRHPHAPAPHTMSSILSPREPRSARLSTFLNTLSCDSPRGSRPSCLGGPRAHACCRGAAWERDHRQQQRQSLLGLPPLPLADLVEMPCLCCQARVCPTSRPIL